MPRTNALIDAFNAGELSEKLAARLSFDKYPLAAGTLKNALPLVQGAFSRRPGSRYVAPLKDQTKVAKLLDFRFSTTQAYVVEAGEGAMRFFKDQGQIVVGDTDASITNGTLPSNITDWDDRSTGSGGIAWELLGLDDDGTFSTSATSNQVFGDASAANRKNAGMLFASSGAFTLNQVRCRTNTTHTANGNVVARIYSDSSGSPNAQVGGDSDTVSINAASTTFTFTWSADTPTFSASTSYWVVLANTDTLLNSSLDTIADQGLSYASGAHDTISSIADASGTFPAGEEWRIEVLVEGADTNGVLSLIPGGTGSTDIGWAEQDVAVGASFDTNEHVLMFRVLGAASDQIELRIGTATGLSDIVADVAFEVGYHCYAFTPGDGNNTIYIQFRNLGSFRNKTVQIDDVSLIDNAAVEIATPYLESEVFGLARAQSADILYIASGNHPVNKLTRSGHSSWSLVEVAWADGPYMIENTSSTTLTASAANGYGITVTASGSKGINGKAGFKSTDVGRLLRIKNASDWAWGVIVGFTSASVVTVDHRGTTDFAVTGQTAWRIGSWSATTGHPRAITFYEQRLALAGSSTQPQSFWLSQSADFENMAPDNGADTVEDDDALDFTIAASQVNVIRWVAGGRNLMIGTVGGEWLVKSDGPILTPIDIDVKRQTTHGSAAIQPLEIGHVVLFLQSAKRKIRELVFDFNVNGLKAPDLTVLADHTTATGVVDMAYQQEPQSTVWCARTDGGLASLTYERNQNVVGWSRHTMGGVFGSGGAAVESIVVIPGSDAGGQVMPSGDRDEVWLVVKRTINGATKRYVEFFEGFFGAPRRDDYTSDAAWETAVLAVQMDAFYVDCGLTYDTPLAITGATTADPVVVTAAAHGFADGDQVRIVEVAGMTELNGNSYFIASVASNTFELLALEGEAVSGATTANPVVVTATNHGFADGDRIGFLDIAGMTELNGNTYKVANKTDDTFELTDFSNVDIDGTAFSAYSGGGTAYDVIDGSAFTTYESGGEVRKKVTSVAGLDHLEGETLSILADGAVHPQKTVASGQITLDTPASKVQAGLGYTHTWRSLKMAVGAPSGTAVGRTKRVHGITLVLLDSMGGKVGPDEAMLEDLVYREVGDAMDTAVPFFSGEKRAAFDGDWGSDGRIMVRGSAPVPFTCLAVVPELTVNDIR